jgi:hypothetical protein
LIDQSVPPCRDCKKWLYNDDWRPVTRGGKRIRRPPRMPTPCGKCPKGPVPFVRELSSANHQAYRFALEIRATNQTVTDPVAGRVLGLIQSVEELIARNRDDGLQSLLSLLIASRATTK